MNIKITYNWLLEYLETDASPYDLQKYLSLCGPSVESVEKSGDDYVLSIEITSNRVDAASVFGVTQEAVAILSQFGKKAKLKINPLDFSFKSINKGKKEFLKIIIKDKDLVSRFTTVVLSGVKITKSPDFIQKRLQMCGVKTINNVVDISNYLMIALGQPTHVFDYDKIKDRKMILRESKKGEKIVTLDEKEIVLPGGDIVIEDGSGKLIDLCGIMGGLNSAVSRETKNVVLFVQTYNKQKIRRTSMLTGQHSVAATYFEKGIDEERVEPTLVYGVELLKEYATGKVASKIQDIYPGRYRGKKVSINYSDINRIIGVYVDKRDIKNILQRLGFGVSEASDKLKVTIPSYRENDIDIKEDLVEEVARIYGYFNLPNSLQPMTYVKHDINSEKNLNIQSRIRHFLKRIGLNEVINYSMVSEENLKNLELDIKNHLKLLNPISEELSYMRRSLLTSLVKNTRENQGKKEELKFFEIGKVYFKQEKKLPKEVYKLGIAVNTSFFDLKGIVEALLRELNIESYNVRRTNAHIFSPNVQAEFIIKGVACIHLGQLKQLLQSKNRLKKPVFIAEIDIQTLADNYRLVSNYKPINPYATIKLDLTEKIDNFEKFKENAYKTSKFLDKLELVDVFKDKVTIRFYFCAKDRNLTEKEAQKDLEKIIKEQV